MQTRYAVEGGAVRRVELPAPDAELSPGVPWGRVDVVMTPAWWRGQSWHHELLGRYGRLRLGADLVEEVAACLLGGHGMPAEVGLAAFRRLRDAGMLRRPSGSAELEAALRSPLQTSLGTRRYRFPRSKARQLDGCLKSLLRWSEPEGDLDLREALLSLPGIGLKTASWVVRNHRASDEVAILDVHVLRACRAIGVFPSGLTPAKDYRALESLFLDFARRLGVRPGFLDAIMWDQMRILSPLLERDRTRVPTDREMPSGRSTDDGATHGPQSAWAV